MKNIKGMTQLQQTILKRSQAFGWSPI